MNQFCSTLFSKMEVIDVKACRLCLMSDVKMFVIDSSSEHCLKSFLGQNIIYTSGLPRYTCYECTSLISKIKKFKTKCLVAQTVLYNIVKNNNVVTENQIKNIDRKKMKLQSVLGIHQTKIASIYPNEEDITIDRLKEIDDGDGVMLNETICDLGIDSIKTEDLDHEDDMFINENSDDDDILMDFVDNNKDHKKKRKDDSTISEESGLGDADLYCEKCDIQCASNRSLQRHRINSSKHNGNLRKRKRYSEESLTLAVEAVRAGMARRDAVSAFGVPYSTLGLYKRDPSRSCRRPGPAPMLTGEEEQHLAQWIVKLKPKKSELKNKVLDMLKGDERLNRFTVSQKWMNLFINRHPDTKHVFARQI